MNSRNHDGGNDMSTYVERRPISIWNVVGFVATVAITAFGWGVTYSSLQNSNQENKNAISRVQDDVKDIKSQIPMIGQLQYQMTTVTQQANDNKASVANFNNATNQRIDRVVQTLSDKLDSISENVNKLSTSVEVLTTRMGFNKQKGQ